MSHPLQRTAKVFFLPAVTCAVFATLPAHAAIFNFTYTDTVSVNTGVDNISVGDTAVITYQLDNGGTSLFNQTWTATDLVSVTFDFGNGAHTTTFDPIGTGGLDSSIGDFVTDGLGQLTAAPSSWFDSLGVISTNSAQTPTAWFVNSANPVYFTDGGNVRLVNVSENTDPKNWTIEEANPARTPEPSVILGLIGVGLLGLLTGKRK